MESDEDTVGSYDDYQSDDEFDVYVDDIYYDEDVDKEEKGFYSVLSESDVRMLQEEEITKLSHVLSISRNDSCILLCHYSWDVNKVQDEWFADEAKVRRTVGLSKNSALLPSMTYNILCRICFENYEHSQMCAAPCGHLYCRKCYTAYITFAINDGPVCLRIRCPETSCAVAIGPDMISSLVSDEFKEKYARVLFNSYLENDKETKWCPAPGCNYAVKFDLSNSIYDVSCACKYSFCWNCSEETHRPVGCKTVKMWMVKNSSEAENTNWILANSKPCPKCKRPIEKNHGCMHMTCSMCKFEFCWLCLGDWSKHGKKTGGFYACNHYAKAKAEGQVNEEETRREMAKNHVEKYTHYYERWATNQKAREKATEDLKGFNSGKLEELSKLLHVTIGSLGFVTDAWKQIIDCRGVLKWTYPYGYYIPENEVQKKELFEYLQGTAESALEQLHKCAEEELLDFFNDNNPPEPSAEYMNFKGKLIDLTKVTQKYFANLVSAFETNLQEVVCSKKKHDPPPETSAPKKKNKSIRKSSESKEELISKDEENWECAHCTHINSVSLTLCEVCEFENPLHLRL